MTTTTDPEERIARMEGQLDHMATSAEIERVRAEVNVEIQRQSAILTWRMIIVAGISQAIGIGALLQFLPR